ncbi:hypothetical protein MAR_003410 [Mya arenaria]|nr:uncharacterized protein LOC128221351 [Mya arenaria]WAR29842.1 hypothetical protein MAR_003410 [Mya arenaria]
MEESQHGVLTYENVCGNSSVMGTKTESTRQEVDLDRPKPPPANEVMCEVLENPLTKLCGIVGKVSLHFEDKGIRIMRSDGKASVEIPLNMIRKFGRKQTIMFYFEVGRRFCFGEGFIIMKCCSPEDAKLVNSYLDEAFGKRK